MVQQVFFVKKKSVLHLSWTWDPQIWHLQNSTSKVCHWATARHHLWDAWKQIFFRWSLGTISDATWVRWATWAIGPQQGRENHGLGYEWHFFFELSIRYFGELIDLIATYFAPSQQHPIMMAPTRPAVKSWNRLARLSEEQLASGQLPTSRSASGNSFH